jgi:hypothetical protein
MHVCVVCTTKKLIEVCSHTSTNGLHCFMRLKETWKQIARLMQIRKSRPSHTKNLIPIPENSLLHNLLILNIRCKELWSRLNFNTTGLFCTEMNTIRHISNNYMLIKKSLCTWWLQNTPFLPHYLAHSDILAADRQGQGDTRLTLTPSVIPNSNYVIVVSDWNCLKCFFAFFAVIIRCTETFWSPCRYVEYHMRQSKDW